MSNSLDDRQVTGIILVVLGLVALAGWLNHVLILAAGIALLVYGIAGLIGKVRTSQFVAILCVVAGALLILRWFPFLNDLLDGILTVVGIVLIVVGILKLMGK